MRALQHPPPAEPNDGHIESKQRASPNIPMGVAEGRPCLNLVIGERQHLPHLQVLQHHRHNSGLFDVPSQLDGGSDGVATGLHE